MPACENCGAHFEQGRYAKRSCTQSCAIKLSWKNPATAAKRAAGIQASRSDPAFLVKMSAVMSQRWSDPATAEAMAAANRERWQDQEMRAKMVAANQAAANAPEERARRSKVKRARDDRRRYGPPQLPRLPSSEAIVLLSAGAPVSSSKQALRDMLAQAVANTAAEDA